MVVSEENRVSRVCHVAVDLGLQISCSDDVVEGGCLTVQAR
uniref:Uncharacterized protein n=1 Tax=Zea mays TaxID=4577 RepID=C4J787_MAIZE|nr:unknown [Zea mays]ACR37086.1 unknown [Zea mays]